MMVMVVMYFQPHNKIMSPQVSCVRRALDTLDMVYRYSLDIMIYM